MKKTTKHFRLLSNHSADGMFVVDLETNKLLLANPLICEMLGYSEDELRDISLSDLHPEEDASDVLEQFRRLSKKETVIVQGIRMKKKDGTILYADMSAPPLPLAKETLAIGAIRNASERVRIHQELRESNERFQSVFEASPNAISINKLESGIFVDINPRFTELFGHTREDIIGKGAISIKLWDDPLERRHFMIKLKQNSSVTCNNVRFRDKNGNIIPVNVAAKKIMLANETHILTFAQDLTERIQAKEALGKSELRYKRLLESVTDYIYTVKIDNDAPVSTTHGPGCLSVTGYSSEEYAANPQLWYDMIWHEDRYAVTEQANQASSKKWSTAIEHRIIHKDGSIRWIRNTTVPLLNTSGHLAAYDGLIKDITAGKRAKDEKAKLQAQLMQSQKMEAMGQLAGGVAHDFNNIICAIMGFSDLIHMRMKDEDESMPYVLQIKGLTTRAAKITRSLLSFSRKQDMAIQPVNLNAVINDIGRLLLNFLGEDITLEINLTENDIVIMADSGQIGQILMNMATNARDAMPNGGLLNITTNIFEIDEVFIGMHGYGKIGKYALLTIADSGVGIDEISRSRIFEPFFTTKEVGKGTGLGLSIVYGIVKQHNGYINVCSEPGMGTTFRIYLPVVEIKAAESAAKEIDRIDRGRETILLAEDEIALRFAAKSMLEKSGYTVIEAIDGQDAVNKFHEHGDAIKLLLTDVVMPGKSGKEAYNEIKELCPGIKVIFMSGYTRDSRINSDILREGLEFISKPVPLVELCKKIRTLLDANKK